MNQRLLIDENVPLYLITHLRNLGYDFLHVRDVQMALADEDVLTLAVRDKRILITFDRDFGELIFRQGLEVPPAIVYVRMSPVAREAVCAAVSGVLGPQAALIDGHLVVIAMEGIRSRRFPLAGP